MKSVSLAALGPLAFVLGCSTYTFIEPKTPPIEAFGPPSVHAATVCVLRPSHWGLNVTFVVHDDAQLVGATRGESYFCYYAAPGPHRIVSTRSDVLDDAATATLHARVGQRYWLHQRYDSFFGNQLEWLDEERARQMIEGCDYKELVEAPGDETPPEDVPFARALATRGD
jgi:hypothetical protein